MINLLQKLSWDWSQDIKDHFSYYKSQFQSKKFRNLSIIGLALFVFIQAFVPGSASALNPKFNFLPGDYELLRGANSSGGEQTWHDPINGKAGDVISWNVYYHNGVEQTTAKNTQIQVKLPIDSAKQLVLTGKLWANNAEAVIDSGTVNLTSAAKIKYISGSTIWYKDGSKTPQPLPDGITAGGVNIGDILGCWPYTGFVVFQTEIISSKVEIEINKTVGNSTEDPHTQNWYKENIAKNGQTLAYRLYIKNTGNDVLKNLKVRDILPAHTTYVNGSTKGYTQKHPEGLQLPDGITSTGGIKIGNDGPSDLYSGYIVFQAKINGLVNPGTYTLINTAESWADNATKVQSQATTVVNIGSSKIVKSKTAYNQTQKIDATKTVAQAGNIINYNLWTKNTGTEIAKDFVVNDNISDILEYADVINSYNGIIQGGVLTYAKTDINPGQTINKTFSIKIKNPIPANPQSGKSYDYQLENVYGNIIVVKIFKSEVGYYFNKDVRNISRNQDVFAETVNATYSEELEYRIRVSNTGNINLTNVRVWDKLPEYQKLISGSVRFYGPHGGSIALSDKLTTTGVNLDYFEKGLSGYIVFRVKIASCPPAGEYNLINTAYASTHETGQISDTAQVHLIVCPPVEPPVK